MGETGIVEELLDCEKGEEMAMKLPRLLWLPFMLPYLRFYQRNTRLPIFRLIRSKTENEADKELQALLKAKRDEAQYVQVAGAVMFASVVSCLSWNTIQNVHWSGPALWYASIIMSISAVVGGAQQSILVSSLHQVNSLDVRSRFLRDVSATEPKPRVLLLFGWQAPLMLLSYSMVTFLGGLSSVVLSPLAANPVWGAEAKVSLVYLVFFVSTLLTFVVTSLTVYQVFEEAVQ